MQRLRRELIRILKGPTGGLLASLALAGLLGGVAIATPGPSLAPSGHERQGNDAGSSEPSAGPSVAAAVAGASHGMIVPAATRDADSHAGLGAANGNGPQTGHHRQGGASGERGPDDGDTHGQAPETPGPPVTGAPGPPADPPTSKDPDRASPSHDGPPSSAPPSLPAVRPTRPEVRSSRRRIPPAATATSRRATESHGATVR